MIDHREQLGLSGAKSAIYKDIINPFWQVESRGEPDLRQLLQYRHMIRGPEMTYAKKQGESGPQSKMVFAYAEQALPGMR